MSRRTPNYRLHRPSGQAVVTLDGRDFYLGPHGTEASRAEYDRLVGEWLANHRRLPQTKAADLSIHELLVAYLRWADSYYRESAEPENIRYTIRPLAALYGHTPAADFGPLALKTVRQRMIEDGLCRREINKRIGRIVRIFKWAVENELLPGSVVHALKAVAGLRRGRSEVRESEPVKPVPAAFVEAIRPHVLPQVWAMIELQRLTGMRPGEVVALKGCNRRSRRDLLVSMRFPSWVGDPGDGAPVRRADARGQGRLRREQPVGRWGWPPWEGRATAADLATCA